MRIWEKIIVVSGCFCVFVYLFVFIFLMGGVLVDNSLGIPFETANFLHGAVIILGLAAQFLAFRDVFLRNFSGQENEAAPTLKAVLFSKFSNKNLKLKWFVILFLGGLLGVIIYYFKYGHKPRRSWMSKPRI
jgi:phosphate/sulfate permease